MTPPPAFESYALAVLRTAAEYVGVPALAVAGPSKNQKLSRARHAVWGVIRQQTGTSTVMIGILFGRDHSTVVVAPRNQADIDAVIERLGDITIPPPWQKPLELKGKDLKFATQYGSRHPCQCGSQSVYVVPQGLTSVRFCSACGVKW